MKIDQTKWNKQLLHVLTRPTHGTLVRAFALLALLSLAVILMIFAVTGTRTGLVGRQGNNGYVKARVEAVLSDTTSPDRSYCERKTGQQQLRVRILEGAYQGRQMNITNYINVLHDIEARQGMTLVVQITTQSDGSHSASVYNYDRSGALIALGVVVLLLLCIAGGRKGLQSMLGIVFTILCVVFILLPFVLKGASPVGTALLVVVLTTAVGFILLDGISRKTIPAFVSTVVGALFSAGAAGLVGSIASLNGFHMQEAEALLLQSPHGQIPIHGLLVAGILISAHGAVMDIAITIASAVEEFRQESPHRRDAEYLHFGMRVGRDAMGTMVNTLVLAYVGSSLNTLLLLYSYGISFAQLINTDLVGVELLEGLAGSLGIILTVPLVAFLAAFVMGRFRSLQSTQAEDRQPAEQLRT
ncbi:MAG: YibE/F family protein [Ethanoligenens sp.]